MTYGLVMIVKDEAGIIGPVLRQVRPYISHWTICDTGSTDGTQDIVRAELDGIPGTLHESEWVNFGHNRSEAFALARGTADWLLALDADMTVTVDTSFKPDPKYDAYMLSMGTSAFEYRLPLLLRGDLPWISVGVMHEYTSLPDGRQLVTAATDAIKISYPDRSSPEKTRWQAELLQKAFDEDPSNPRTVFYLAQALRERNDPGDLERARDLYELRSTMGSFEQEAWYAGFMAATLIPTAEARVLGLLASWELRPHRLEPLHAALRILNSLGLHHAAYALTSFLPHRKDTMDTLFVHRAVWQWGIAFERSIAAWWVGNKAECRAISLALLQQDLPQDVREAVERNLQLSPEEPQSRLILPNRSARRHPAKVTA